MMKHFPIFLYETLLRVSCDPNFLHAVQCSVRSWYSYITTISWFNGCHLTHHVITATGVPNAQPDVALVVDRRGVGELVRLEREEEETRVL